MEMLRRVRSERRSRSRVEKLQLREVSLASW